MTRLLIVFPYWNGDKVEMERTADLAADLLEVKTDLVDVLFAARFDADYPSPEIIAHLKEKFRAVNFWRCSRIGYSHPDGCNQLAYGVFQFLQDQRKANGAYLDISAILMMEADAVFTRKAWLQELSAAWEEGEKQGKLIVGAIQPGGRWGHDVETHVNALALYHPDLLSHVPSLVGGPVEVGWDYHQRHQTLPLAMDSPLFKLDWRKPTISAHELFEDNKDVLVHHGVKDCSAVNLVREKWELK